MEDVLAFQADIALITALKSQQINATKFYFKSRTSSLLVVKGYSLQLSPLVEVSSQLKTGYGVKSIIRCPAYAGKFCMSESNAEEFVD
jgi:exonuclease I